MAEVLVLTVTVLQVQTQNQKVDRQGDLNCRSTVGTVAQSLARKSLLQGWGGDTAALIRGACDLFVEVYSQEGAHCLKVYQKDKDSKVSMSLLISETAGSGCEGRVERGQGESTIEGLG